MTRYIQPGWLTPPTPHTLFPDPLKQSKSAVG